jgi:hypothetical protein
MQANLLVSWAFVPHFPIFRTDLFLGREALHRFVLLRLKQQTQNQDIVRHHGAPDILPEARPTLPVTAIQAKGPLQPGNIGFDPGPKVPQLSLNPQALDHLQDPQTSLLGEHDGFDSLALGQPQIIPRGKAAVGRGRRP